MIEPFKCERSMFLSLADGSRNFDIRRWDENDARIERLSWLSLPETAQARPPHSDLVAFADKETEEVIYFYFAGIAQIKRAPGWVIIYLGDRTDQPMESEGN